MVDDEPDIRKIGLVSLRSVGKWATVSASSGEEALTLAAQEKPDLILLDVMMPGMTGPDVLVKLRQQPETASIPVIFMTAKVQRTEIDGYLALGAAGVISKPFDPMLLPQQIRAIVEKPNGD
ncbi:MAG TPA: response regulator [Myxococcaceae bacterium]|nr:response regulator [Myxococcaceae bacterium]